MSTAVTKKALPEWKRFRFPQSLYKYGALLAALYFVWWSMGVLRIDPERLPGLFQRLATVLANRYWPPEFSHVVKPEFVDAIIDTFQMSYVATVVGLLLAIPLAWFASFNMTPNRRFLYPVCRLIVMSCRSVHEMIWTIVLVAIVGFGMLPGTLAMTLFCIGFSGKLMAEASRPSARGRWKPSAPPAPGTCRPSSTPCCRRCAWPGPASPSTPGTWCSAPPPWSASSVPAAWATTCARACRSSSRGR
jgi:ABC-type phosphate/phosphonate transport system permease subunit